jgi:hypothetical protein
VRALKALRSISRLRWGVRTTSCRKQRREVAAGQVLGQSWRDAGALQDRMCRPARCVSAKRFIPRSRGVALGVFVMLAVGCASCITPSGRTRASPSRATVAPSRMSIRLVHPEPPLTSRCQAAADRLHFTVPCPSLVPVTTDSFVPCSIQGGCVLPRLGRFLMEFAFTGPPGYEGKPGEGGSNHLFLVAATAEIPQGGPLSLRPACYTNQADGRTRVAGIAAAWIPCPESDAASGINSGHIILVWNIGRVKYGVSVHTDTPVNRELLETFASSLTYIRPA